MFRRQLLIQEGVMAMPLHKLIGRALAINVVSLTVCYGIPFAVYVYYQKNKKTELQPTAE